MTAGVGINLPRMSALQHDYVRLDDLAAKSEVWWKSVLGVAGFDGLPPLGALPLSRSIPVAASGTPCLGALNDVCEVWRVNGDRGALVNEVLRQGRVRIRHGDDLLFGSMLIEEAGGGSGGLVRATTTAYEDLFSALDATGFAHLVRIWNYLPDINGEADGEERYRHFNSARQTAFRAADRATIGSVPAASALGSPAGGPISVFFLASRHAPAMIENPRQTSAYHYPSKFGAYSPTFSRACVLGQTAGTTLLVSGTASILGHESVHPGDVVAQTLETLVNIQALLREANRLAAEPRYVPECLKYKVYVRRAGDLPAVQGALAAAVQPQAPVVYLHADICRDDLLVEIEAIGESAPG